MQYQDQLTGALVDNNTLDVDHDNNELSGDEMSRHARVQTKPDMFEDEEAVVTGTCATFTYAHLHVLHSTLNFALCFLTINFSFISTSCALYMVI